VRITAIPFGLRSVAIDAAQDADGNFVISTPGLGGTYRGRLSADGSVLAGMVTTPAGPMLLDFKPAKAIPPRAQEPNRPYPYADEEVSFSEEKSGIRFHGTLTVPRGPGPHPAVVLISGSGCQDRDETIGDSKRFLVVADALTRRGVAVLRCDDRGFGATGGSVLQATDEDLATDALAAVAFLAARKEIAANEIGLVGQGEGGLVAMTAAGRSPAVRFVATLAGFAEKGDRLAYQSVLNLTGAQAYAEPLRSAARDAIYRAIVAIKSDTGDAGLKKQLGDLVPPELVPVLASPWMRALTRLDPAPAIRKVQVPILALFADEDPYVPADANSAAFEAAIRQGGNRNVTVLTFPRLDHWFRIAAPTMADGPRCNDTIAPEVLEKLASWVASKANAADSGR
jgi:dienelactone hydrolase